MEIEKAIAHVGMVGAVEEDDDVLAVIRGVLLPLAPTSVRTYSSDLADLFWFFRGRPRPPLRATRDDLLNYAASLRARKLAPDSRRRRLVAPRPARGRICYAPRRSPASTWARGTRC